jgi:hypothetical protein
MLGKPDLVHLDAGAFRVACGGVGTFIVTSLSPIFRLPDRKFSACGRAAKPQMARVYSSRISFYRSFGGNQTPNAHRLDLKVRSSRFDGDESGTLAPA